MLACLGMIFADSGVLILKDGKLIITKEGIVLTAKIGTTTTTSSTTTTTTQPGWTDYTNLLFYHDFATTSGTRVAVAQGDTNWNMVYLFSGFKQVVQGSGYVYNFVQAADDLLYTDPAVTMPACTAITVMAWHKIRSVIVAATSIDITLDSANTFILYDNSAAGKWAWLTFGGGQFGYVQNQTALATNVWYHIACTWNKLVDGGVPHFYLNGVIDDDITIQGGNTATIGPFSSILAGIGNDVSIHPTRTLDGYMGDVMVYTNRLLTSNEQLQVFNAQKTKYGL